MSFSNMAVVVDQQHGFKPFTRSHRCRLQSYTHLDFYNAHEELSESNDLVRSLKEAFEVANIHRSFSTPCLPLTPRVEEEFDTTPTIKIICGQGARGVHSLIIHVAMAMASGVDLVLVSSGLGGAYILRSRNGDNIAVVKPVDEEPFALNNPKGFGGRMLGQPGLKRSVRTGETGVRELAAYLLDYDGFAGVPSTALVKISHVAFHVNNSSDGISTVPCKIASLQRFVDHDFDAGELGPSGFSVSSIHRIGIFDVRILNLDRHAGNILVKKQEYDNYAVGVADLVPVDHGLCLPEWLDDPYFEWLHWPQSSVPFSESEIEYISNLDPFKDAELLRTELRAISESSIRILMVCTIFLKQATTAGLCLADIGEMMTREFCSGEEKMSALENLCAQAMARMPKNLSDPESKEEITGEYEMFQFDNESDNGYNEISEIPQLLKNHPRIPRPPKIPNFSSAGSKLRLANAVLSPLDDINSNEKDDNGDNQKVGNLIKSVSFSEQNHNGEPGVISFGEMSKDEWEVFLECFEKLLPDALEGTKGMNLKQRMGASCKF